jgi:hypothetical protein
MLSGAVGAVIGAIIGGLFVMRAVQLQFKRQSEAACRALRVEIEGNLEAISQMISDRPVLQYPDGHADPGWLKRGIWDSQLPYLAQALDPLTLADLQLAYSTLEPLPRMRLQRRVEGDEVVRYARGGWIETHLDTMKTLFDQAENSLRDRLSQIESEHWDHRAWRCVGRAGTMLGSAKAKVWRAS